MAKWLTIIKNKNIYGSVPSQAKKGLVKKCNLLRPFSVGLLHNRKGASYGIQQNDIEPNDTVSKDTQPSDRRETWHNN